MLYMCAGRSWLQTWLSLRRRLTTSLSATPAWHRSTGACAQGLWLSVSSQQPGRPPSSCHNLCVHVAQQLSGMVLTACAECCLVPWPPPLARVRKDQIEAKARELAALQSQLDADTQELDQLKVSRAVSGGQEDTRGSVFEW